MWFKPQSLQALADAGAWTRGLMLYRSQKVLSLDIEPLQDHWLVLGEVQGTQHEPYEVSIELALMPDGQVDYWDCECECPVGTQCKHGVALLLKAAYQGLQLLGGQAGSGATLPQLSPPTPEQVEAMRLAAQARAQEIARLQAEAELLRWLQDLDKAKGMTTDGSDKRPEQYLYLLTVLGAHGPTPRLQMEAVVSYRKVTGGWAKPKAIKTAPYKGQPVYDRATDEDRQVLQLMRAMPESSRYTFSFSSTAILGGQAGLLGLQLAAGTGRLFLDDGRNGPGTTIHWGPPQSLDWQWQEVPNQQATEPGWALRAHLADSTARLCLNNPPLYLDAAQGLCGTVQADNIPAAQLEVLLKAPPLKPSVLQKY